MSSASSEQRGSLGRVAFIGLGKAPVLAPAFAPSLCSLFEFASRLLKPFSSSETPPFSVTPLMKIFYAYGAGAMGVPMARNMMQWKQVTALRS
jgi:hypothetical protein